MKKDCKVPVTTTGKRELSEKELLKAAICDYIDSQPTLCKDNTNVLMAIPSLLQLQNDKGRVYGRSWCKHQDMSAFFNLERKWDRISNIMENSFEKGIEKVLNSEESETPTETFLDTVVDLANYSLMWVGLIRELRYEKWQKWLQANEVKDYVSTHLDGK